MSPAAKKPSAILQAWTVGQLSVSTDADGNVVAEVPVLEDGQAAATVSVTLTPDRHLTVLWDAAEGSEPLAGFQAWSTD